ncbi:MAG TPA: DUF4212 domain-containing protein [Pararobbsia sp.]|nr:DUF4212 domain-containing protein [Pararobbsia sp.]
MAYRAYWRFNVRVIAILLGIGALVSFGVPLFAESLQHIHFAGWSLPFYVGAQGATIVYLALVGIYIGAMTWADRRLRHAIRQSRPVESTPSVPSHRRHANRSRQA